MTGDSTAHDVSVVGYGGSVLRLTLYNPVIGFSVFGPDEFYDVLGLALDALHRFGEYDGMVCIAADRSAEAVAHVVPNAFGGRWRHIASSARDGLFNRYDMPVWGPPRSSSFSIGRATLHCQFRAAANSEFQTKQAKSSIVISAMLKIARGINTAPKSKIVDPSHPILQRNVANVRHVVSH